MIVFALISLFYVQIQEPASRSATMRAFVFLATFAKFFYHKIFETRSWWRFIHLRGWAKDVKMWRDVDVRCGDVNWRCEDLSMSHDQKIMTLQAQIEKCPMDFYQEVVFTAQIW